MRLEYGLKSNGYMDTYQLHAISHSADYGQGWWDGQILG
jgi:hypothetical protein